MCQETLGQAAMLLEDTGHLDAPGIQQVLGRQKRNDEMNDRGKGE